jgi:hypothetical protein
VIGKFSGPIGGLVDDAAKFGSSVVQGRPGAIGQGIELANISCRDRTCGFRGWRPTG